MLQIANTLYKRSKYLNYAFLSFDNLQLLANSFQLADIVLGEFKDSICSIVYFPVNLLHYDNSTNTLRTGNLKINDVVRYDTLAYDPNSIKRLYFVAKHHPFYFLEDTKTWQLFDPYTTLEIYLPFYGVVNIPTKDLWRHDNNKFSPICIFLTLDYTTGEASYIICADDSDELEFNENTRFLEENQVQIRILSILSFQLGVQIPVGSSNMADIIRNGIMGAASIAASYYTGTTAISKGLGVATSVTKGTITTKVPKGKSNKLQIKDVVEQDLTTTIDRTNNVKERMISDVTKSSVSAIENLQTKAETSRPNNVNLLENVSLDVVFIVKFATFNAITPSYKRLNGLPLGQYEVLGNLTGYTEITDVHVEGQDFNTATQEELVMLDEALKGGIIL